MNKSLLPMFCFLLSALMLTGQPVRISSESLNKGVKAEYSRPVKDRAIWENGINPSVSNPIREISEHQLGTSFYDLQSNYMLQNRICYNPSDGTIGVVWTKGMEAPNFGERGTGYNFYDGTSWLPEPEARIENAKTGWPNYAFLGESGEIVIAHLASGLEISKREQKGQGEWSFSELFGPPEAADLTWPRMITSGEDRNTVHLLANTYDPYLGQTSALLYYRSTDGGETWDIEHELIDGLGEEYYTEIGADAYGWAEAKGDTLAFLVASAWHDMFVMKSYDNGDSWEKILIWEHPYPLFDWESTITDTFFCVDNSATIALDGTGKVHVMFGINRVLHATPVDEYTFFPLYDGIGYWNEDMPAFSNDLDALSPPQYGFEATELVEDYNYVGWTQDVDGDGEIDFIADPIAYRTLGLSTMPSLAVDHSGSVFFIYASTTETYDNLTNNYKHIWARAFCSSAGSWGTFTDLTGDIIHIFDEFYFPQLAPQTDEEQGLIHMVYNIDATPGIAWSEQHDWQENRLVYASASKSDFCPVGIIEQEAHEGFSASQIFPNPSTEVCYIKADLPRQARMTKEIFDLTGKKHLMEELGWLKSGTHYLKIDTGDLPPGLYLLRLAAGDHSVVRKMTVR